MITLFVYYNFLDLLSTTVCSQNINKQTINMADENYTKSKNYLKRRYRIRHRIPYVYWYTLYHTMVGDYSNTMKTDFVYLFQTVNQNEYTQT